MKRLYLSMQIANYSTFLLLDLLGKQVFISNLFKFFSICLCLFYIWTLGGEEIFTAAVALTTVSDFFLLFTSQISMGMVCFCAVQLLYLYSLVESKKSILVYVFVVFVGTSLLLLFLNSFISIKIDRILLLSFLYFGLLLRNLFESWRQKKRYGDRYHQILFAGFLLFVLCDIHVALFNMTYYLPYFSMSKGVIVTRVIGFLIWMYYLPSQMILSHVGVLKNKKGNC